MTGGRSKSAKEIQESAGAKILINSIIYLSCTLFSFLFVLNSPALAVRNDIIDNNDYIIIDDQRGNYDRCIDLAHQRAETAIKMAERWFNLSKLEAAMHCRAIALTTSGQHELAANALEKIANNTDSSVRIKAGLYQHAAQVWVRARKPSLALSALNKAVAIDVTNIQALEDRAILNADQSEFWSAIDDLNTIIDIDPNNTSAIVLRASAYRQLDINTLALENIDLALSFEKNNVDALLELSLLKKSQQKISAAIQIWERIIQLAPQSESAISAKMHLENQQ